MLHSNATDGGFRTVSYRYYLGRRKFWILLVSFQALRKSLGARREEVHIVMGFATRRSDTYPMRSLVEVTMRMRMELL